MTGIPRKAANPIGEIPFTIVKDLDGIAGPWVNHAAMLPSPLPSTRAFTPVFDGLCGERPGEGPPPHGASCGGCPSPRPSP